MSKGLILLAAGGTGGHLFPAQALAEELNRRGYEIHLMTDKRISEYGKEFPALQTHIIPSSSPSLRKIWTLPSRSWRIFRGYRKASRIFKELKPKAVIGFGGYPSFPPILAAATAKIPICIHDQNAVIGRANLTLAPFATKIASSFSQLIKLPARQAGKLVYTGNPVRDGVRNVQASLYPTLGADCVFRLLVFGGSQGAQFFAHFMPKLIENLPKSFLENLYIVQQCRQEDLETVRIAYERAGLRFQLASFFPNMPEEIAAAHLVICRSGASSIAELGVIGRPAILVPLPHSIDNDQLLNARAFVKDGGGWIREQANFDAAEFSAFLTFLRYQESDLQFAARAALKQGKPEAAERLADLMEELACGNEVK